MIRRALRILLGLVVLGALVLGAPGLWLHLGGAGWALNRVLQRVNPYPGTSVVVGSVGGSLLRTARIRDVEFRTASGEVLARVDRVRVRYSPGELLSGEITIDAVEIAGADIRLKRRPDGTWELPEKPAGKPGENDGKPKRINIRSVRLENVDITAADIHASDLALRARNLTIEDGVEIGIDTVAFRLRPPEP